jgi:hypothetical protein
VGPVDKEVLVPFIYQFTIPAQPDAAIVVVVPEQIVVAIGLIVLGDGVGFTVSTIEATVLLQTALASPAHTAKYVVLTRGETTLDVGNVNAVLRYHSNVEPDAQLPVRVAVLPEQIVGATRLVGATGIGVTVITELSDGLLHDVFAVLIQTA